ncbi:MAG: TolC family protein [Oligoflexia bacterium]|nr:TolC family protein [Oligoflexia bacterium]
MKNRIQFFSITAFFSLFICYASWAKHLDLSSSIKQVLDTHPAIAAAHASYYAEKVRITPLYFPENPKIGLMSENSMQSWSVSQELSIPMKYYYRGLAQEQLALSMQEELTIKKLQLRKEVIMAYYELFQREKSLELLQGQRDLLKQIARIAESRRTVGQVSIQDEMRAHLEQAKLENDILMAEQDKIAALAKLEEILGTENKATTNEQELAALKLETPKITIQADQLKSIAHSLSSVDIPSLKAESFKITEALAQKTIAKTNYWPDFELSYQKSLEKDNDNKKVAIEFKIPLWFFAKESNEVSAASEKIIGAQKKSELVKRELQSRLSSLAAKILAKENILKLYETTLIPQGISTTNSAQSAYKAGRVGFFELLDSERTVYNLRISFYQELKEYTEAISEFESNLGRSISSLPFEGVL